MVIDTSFDLGTDAGAGPAADALLHDKLDDQSLHWLHTNFLKTELELGHCLRLPAEGPANATSSAPARSS